MFVVYPCYETLCCSFYWFIFSLCSYALQLENSLKYRKGEAKNKMKRKNDYLPFEIYKWKFNKSYHLLNRIDH